MSNGVSRTCGACGAPWDMSHVCPSVVPNPLSSPMPHQPDHGWICPLCGYGIAPWRSRCDCRGGLGAPLFTMNGP